MLLLVGGLILSHLAAQNVRSGTWQDLLTAGLAFGHSCIIAILRVVISTGEVLLITGQIAARLR